MKRVDGGDDPRPSSALHGRGYFFETLPGLYLLVDPDLKILDATDAYLAATMTRRDEIVGRGLFDVFPENPDDAGATGENNLRRSMERVKRTLKPDSMAVQKYDVRTPAEDGGQYETRYWSPINTPVVGEDGTLSHIVLQVEDVTDFVDFRAESDEQRVDNRQLRGEVESMQAEILRRSAELHEANVRLRAANEAKNLFLGRMSHELRSPLTAVIGYSELLELDAAPGSEEMESAGAIFRAGAHLLELINEVLDISQVESGQMTMSIEPTALDNALVSAVELMRPFAAGHGITLDLPERPSALYVKADPQRLTQVIVNLVSNAIKYNAPHGRVKIRVTESSEKRACISIADTGHGIPVESLVKLFEPFERLGAEATEIQGTGLGLSLSRSLLERMGGTIHVESKVGVGSTFSVELTKVEPQLLEDTEVAKAPELSMLEYPEPRKLLYIEDTAANLRLVERVLERRPQVTVLPAMLGGLGVDLAREHKPDLILLDLHLPDVNGTEVLARLKADPSTEEIPVVILSADATSRQNAEVLALGADSYLTKPIRIADLLSTVDSYLLPA
ncbi:MAG: response regulator [Thermoleophilaceae bacterium]|nr:response regulator [Thermoleophilaceae bacterium]